MEKFQKQLKKAQELTPQKVSRELFDFIQKLKKEIEQYNKAQLFIDSKDINNEPIGFYSQATERITNGRKKAGQPFNLFETGDLLNSLSVKVEETRKKVLFDFTDPKYNEVKKNLLSKEILGLTDENLLKALQTPAKKFIQEYYRKEFKI